MALRQRELGRGPPTRQPRVVDVVGGPSRDGPAAAAGAAAGGALRMAHGISTFGISPQNDTEAAPLLSTSCKAALGGSCLPRCKPPAASWLLLQWPRHVGERGECRPEPATALVAAGAAL